MAKIDLKHLDHFNNDYIKACISKNIANDGGDLIQIEGYDSDCESNFNIYLDKCTAIKFAKTLRTEINKIKDNGTR